MATFSVDPSSLQSLSGTLSRIHAEMASMHGTVSGYEGRLGGGDLEGEIEHFCSHWAYGLQLLTDHMTKVVQRLDDAAAAYDSSENEIKAAESALEREVTALEGAIKQEDAAIRSAIGGERMAGLQGQPVSGGAPVTGPGRSPVGQGTTVIGGGAPVSGGSAVGQGTTVIA
jgi:hypothetical protein